MMILIFALIAIIAYLFIPCLIVGLWKKRPRRAFCVAMLTLFLTVITPPLIDTFPSIMVYGQDDAKVIAGVFSEIILMGIIGLILLGPIVFLFQWFVLRRHKKKLAKVDADKVFS